MRCGEKGEIESQAGELDRIEGLLLSHTKQEREREWFRMS